MCQTKVFASSLLVLCLIGFSRAEPQCQRIDKVIPDKLQCGYDYTARFNFDHHYNISLKIIKGYKSMLKNCSAFVNTMICSLYLPRCTEEIKGPYLPCRGVCYAYANECSEVIQSRGLEWTAAMCEFLPEKDNPQTTQGYRERCFTPPNYKDSSKSYKYNCSDVVIPACQGIPGYTKTVASPKRQREINSHLTSLLRYNTTEPCSLLRKAMLCTDLLPGCVEGTAGLIRVCRDKCLTFFNTCNATLFANFGSDICIEFPKREGSHELPVCKDNHWPRSENWQLHENPTTPTVTSGSPNIQAKIRGGMSAGTISGILLVVVANLVGVIDP